MRRKFRAFASKMMYCRMLRDLNSPPFRLLLRRSTWLVGVLALGLVISLTYSTNLVGSARGPATGTDLAPAASSARTVGVVPGRKWVAVQSVAQPRTAGRTAYAVGVQVKAQRGTPWAKIQIRQLKGRKAVARAVLKPGATTRAWRTLRLGLVSKKGKSRIQVRVKASAARSIAVRVTAINARAVAPSGGGGGGGAASTGACVSNKLGIPSSGAYAGAVVGGKVSLASREKAYGRRMGVHRTYHSASGVSAAAKQARSDVAAKRVPWMSFKVPGTWKQMAAGKYDAWALGLTKQLNAVPGPVWIAFHHEPESEGQAVADWTRMQAHLMRIVKDHSDNIATTMIVMGYWQAMGNKPELKLPRLWPGNGLIDIIGMDPYNFYSTMSNGQRNTKMTDLRPWFSLFNSFAAAHGARWGVAETAYTNEAAAKNPAWITNTFNQLVAYRGVAMSYFDTTLNNSGNSWPLLTSAKLAAHAKNVRASKHIC
jgi:hypothetical protein